MTEEVVFERELLVCCVRAFTASDTPAALEALLAKPIDWPCFLRLAHKHQVSPLIASVLCGRLATSCPAEVLEDLRLKARRIASTGVAAARSLRDVVGVMQSGSVEVIAYKGPLLSALAYGQPGLREFGDLDVLVHDWDYCHVVGRLLAKEGWGQIADYGFERSYLHEDGRTVLDVHRSFAYHAVLPLHVDFSRLFERSVDWKVMGTPVKTLSPADLLVVLCIQLAKDAGEQHRSPPLIKVCDIALLVRSQPDLAWEVVLLEARRLGVLHVVCLGLAVAVDLLGCPVPEAVRRLNGQVPELDSLVRHVEERIFAGEGERYSRPELLDPLTWNAAIRERFQDRNQTMIWLKETVLAPNQRDYAFVRLPRLLSALYRLVKPVRLVLKASRRLAGKSAV